MNGEIAGPIVALVRESARRLPWRGHPDPYAVGFPRSCSSRPASRRSSRISIAGWQRFPDIRSLADASEQDVFALWEGLGYYSRARNLHRAARILVADYGGKIPADRAALEKLPGVGRYTAGAIASIAFGLDEPALDGNIRRVLARLFNVDLPARSPAGLRRLWDLARQTLPPGRAGDYNQALMDLGSMICTPQNPACLLCPLSEICQAHILGLQEQRPVLEAKKPVPHHIVTAAVIHRGDRLLISRRKQGSPAGWYVGVSWRQTRRGRNPPGLP